MCNTGEAEAGVSVIQRNSQLYNKLEAILRFIYLCVKYILYTIYNLHIKYIINIICNTYFNVT